ncbi:MAG: glycoside hydrolase family 3 protein [Clostridia bacterium]|nr:glycoside hydrolase family 3 protein [Clostridia bacterium]
MVKLEDLTLREKICQTVIINHPQEMFKKYGGYKNFLEKYPVGGLYLGGAIVGGPMDGADEFFSEQEEWNKCLKVPYINCCDNPAPGLPSINSMALGATDDEELAYQWGCDMGRICRRNKIHWLFAPVSDLTLSATAPINTRTVGDSPERSARLCAARIRGLQKYGVIATSKHYPGMGRESIDTHIAPVPVHLTKEEWDATYRKIYKHLIDEGVGSFMTGHMSLASYQPNERNERGLYRPGTVSHDLITKLLRDDLGFNGVVVTDGLIMGGFGGSSCELEIEAFKAGNDMLLWPNMEYVDILEEKILSGEISEELLDEKVRRILAAKEFAFAPCNETDVEEYHMPEIIQSICEKSVALFNNYQNLLPLEKDKYKKILLVALHPREQVAKELQALKEDLEERGFEVTLVPNLWIPKLRELEPQHDLTIFAFYEGINGTDGSFALHGDTVVNIWAAQASDPSKTIIAGFGSPYFYTQYFHHIDTYVHTYDYAKPSREAFVKAILGELPFEGICTINIEKNI